MRSVSFSPCVRPLRAVSLAALLLGSLPALAEEMRVRFEFRDPASHAPLVAGDETMSVRADASAVQETVYKELQGTSTQRETLASQPGSQRLAFYRFQDEATGELAEVKVVGGRAEVQYRGATGDATDKATIDWGPSVLTGKELPEFVRRHWDDLRAGKTLGFDLYLPFRLSTLGFRARQTAVSAEGAASQVTVRFEAASWLIRQVAPAIDFVYDVPAGRPPRLVRYLGPSPVRIAGEKHKRVEMVYDRM